MTVLDETRINGREGDVHHKNVPAMIDIVFVVYTGATICSSQEAADVL